MSSYKEIKEEWIGEFERCGLENIAFEINELIGLAMGADPRSADFGERLESEAETGVTESFELLCKRRLNGEPLQYLLGEWEFYGLPFKVGEGVLIPRQDTETVVDIALQKLKDRDQLTVIDLCAGSGCIGIAIEKNLKCSRVVCVEKSLQAYEYLIENITLNESSVEAVIGDIYDKGIISSAPQADLIVCNPPYITAENMKQLQREVRREPELALYGGEDGLDHYPDIIRLWKDKLKDGGMMLFEIGIGQEDEVMKMMIQHGLKDVRTRPDLLGVNRCVFGFKMSSPKLCTDVMSV